MTFRRKKLVRIHFRDADPSIEGVLVGVLHGHYRLAAPKYIDAADHTRALDGEALVPKAGVLFLQVLR